MEEYESSGFKATAHGFNFQLKMLMLVLHRACSTYRQFKLATEMKAADKFDDIVLEYEDDEGQPKVILMQCKHKAQKESFIKSKELNDTKGPFSLNEYFNSYTKIKMEKRFAEISIEALILHTNANVEQEFKESHLKLASKEDTFKILQFEAFEKASENAPTSYRLNDNFKLKFVKNQSEINEFKEKFLLAISQPNEKDLDKLIEKELGADFCIVDSREITNKLYCYVHQWMSDQKGTFIKKDSVETFFKDLKEQIKQVGIEGVIFQNQEKKLEFGDFFYNVEKMNQLHELTLRHPLVHLESKSLSLSIIKIVQSLKNQDNYLVLNLETLLVLASQVIATLQSRINFSIYVECTRFKEQKLIRVMRVLSKLLDIIVESENGNKNIVLVGHENDELLKSLATEYPFVTSSDCCSFDELTLKAKERILDYEVNFQGFDIKLKEILDETSTCFLKEGILNKIVEYDDIVIGKPLSKTNGLHDINVYIKRELKIAKESENAKLCIIKGGPGIGKSTELENMAWKTKNESKNKFVVRINLLDYINEFNKLKEFAKDTLIIFLIKSEQLKSEFELVILKLLLFFSGEIICFLDGFDEISPLYDNAVISLLTVIMTETKVTKVWITSRSHATNILDNEFKTAFYELTPFDENDQNKFLQNYWISLLNVTDGVQRIEMYVKRLLDSLKCSKIETVKDLVGIPLQIRMIADVFVDKCKVWLENGSDQELDNINMDIHDLFTVFINKKFQIYFKEKVKMEEQNPSSKIIAKNELKRDKKELQKMAFLLIFPENKNLCPNPHKGDIQIELLKVGIIEKRDDNFVFIHRTFAEYFSAEFLVEKLNEDNTNAVLIRFLNLHYFTREFYMIRYFCENMLVGNSEIHMATMKNDLKRVKELINEDHSLVFENDAMGRIPLHLACIYTTFQGERNQDLNFPVNNVLDFLIRKDIEKEKPEQIVRRDMFNRIPYVYAANLEHSTKAFALLALQYYHCHFFNYIDLNRIGMELSNMKYISDMVDFDHQDLVKKPFTCKYEVSNNSLLDIYCKKEHFKAIKPYFYKHPNKKQICQVNDYEMLKPALRSYFTDVYCLLLTDPDYLVTLDDELMKVQLCQKWFLKAILSKDYLFLLGITLACPQTAFNLWIKTKYLAFLKESPNESCENVFKKNEFVSENKLKNYLVLAVRNLMMRRGDYTLSSINFTDYFNAVAIDDHISFKISLKLVFEDEKKIFGVINTGMGQIITMAIKENNSYKLYNAFLYFIDNAHPMDDETKIDICKCINSNVRESITYIKSCINHLDLMGLNLLLTYVINNFLVNEAYSISHNFNYIWLKVDNGFHLFNKSTLKIATLKQLHHSLDLYPIAVLRGYPFSLTQHILAHIFWLQKNEVPLFIKQHLECNVDNHNFIEGILESVNRGDIIDFLRYLTFANDEQKEAILIANNSEIIQHFIQSKREFLDGKEVGEGNIFKYRFTKDITQTHEYAICLLHAFERKHLLMLNFLNIFLEQEDELLFDKRLNYETVLKNAFSHLHFKLVNDLLKLPFALNETQYLSVVKEFRSRIERISKDSNSIFYKLLQQFELLEKGEYLRILITIHTYQNTIIKKVCNEINDIFVVNNYKTDCLLLLRESMEMNYYVTYFRHFSAMRLLQGIKSLLQFISDSDRWSVDFYINGHVNRSPNKRFISVAYLTGIQWQELHTYVMQYQTSMNLRHSCSIFKLMYYFIKCFEASNMSVGNRAISWGNSVRTLGKSLSGPNDLVLLFSRMKFYPHTFSLVSSAGKPTSS